MTQKQYQIVSDRDVRKKDKNIEYVDFYYLCNCFFDSALAKYITTTNNYIHQESKGKSH
jgi:hypothetical protein